MNIGILIPGFSDGEADWCIPVYLDLVRSLAQTDSVRVFALRYPSRRDRYPVYGAQVISMGGHSSTAGLRRWALLSRTVAAVIRAHQRQPFDVLHAIWADETGATACFAGRLIGVPVVVSVAGGELARQRGYGLQSARVSRWLVQQAITRADCVTVPCQYTRSLIEQLKLRPRRVSQVPLGVDTTLFQPGLEPASGDRILAVGSLTHVKQHDHLLTIAARLPGICVDIVGDGPLRPVLEVQVKSLGLADRVRFHGAISHDQLPSFYQSAALHVLTSIHEAFGMVTVEAAACGVLTAGYALGVLPELPGVAVPPGDKEVLASVIDDLMSDTQKRVKLGQTARQAVEERFTLEAMVAGMRQVYADVVR